MNKNKTRITIFITIVTLVTLTNCKAQEIVINEEEQEIINDKESWAIGNVFLTNYKDYSLENNAKRLVDSLALKGIEDIIVYKFGVKCYKCPYQGVYLLFEYEGYSSFYEFRENGLYWSYNCASFFFGMDYFRKIETKNKKNIHNPTDSNQYNYQDLVYFSKGVESYALSSRNNSYPNLETLKVYDELKFNIINCFHVNQQRGLKVEKRSD